MSNVSDFNGCIPSMSVSFLCYGRFATIPNYLRGMKDVYTYILEKFQILFCPLPLGSWRTYTTLEVTILLHTRYFLKLFSVLFQLSFLFMHSCGHEIILPVLAMSSGSLSQHFALPDYVIYKKTSMGF